MNLTTPNAKFSNTITNPNTQDPDNEVVIEVPSADDNDITL